MSEDDLREMAKCFQDCQNEFITQRRDLQKCGGKNTLRRFFYHTVPGNIIIAMIIYFLVQNLVGTFLGE